jgi:muramoyltetrapeptide carboxypeptidase LdcA involved in peptidoglycan recycling
MTAKQKVTSLALTDEDRRTVEKAKKILETKGMKVTLADTLKAALYFFVEQKEAEKSVKPTSK